jgi:hypothetical protein
MMATKNVLTQVYLNPTQRTQLLKRSKSTHRNVSELIREAVNLYLEEGALSSEDRQQLTVLTQEARKAIQQMQGDLLDMQRSIRGTLAKIQKRRTNGHHG